MAKSTKRVSPRQRITDALIKSMEENGQALWERPWNAMSARPFNPKTGFPYRGGNRIGLLLAQEGMGSDDPRWMTLKAANDAGYRIRKDAKGVTVEYWKWGSKVTKATDDNDDDDENDVVTRQSPTVFYAHVFNAQDIEGIPPLVGEVTWEPHALAESLIQSTGAEITHGVASGAAAFYSPSKDMINMPPRGAFDGDSSYYATLLHELSHWTGHHSRLGRFAEDYKVEFGSETYAQEELRAEIGSMYICSMLGIEGDVANHAKYANAWLKKLGDDRNEIYRAARDAEKIADALLEYSPELQAALNDFTKLNTLGNAPETKVTADSELDTTDSTLSGFVPADSEPVPTGTGRNDPRWAGFENTMRELSTRYAFEDGVLAQALDGFSVAFTDIMNGALAKGHSAEDMIESISRSLIGELRTEDVREQRWQYFKKAVHHLGDKPYGEASVSRVLSSIEVSYRQLITDALSNKKTSSEVGVAIDALLYGDAGTRVVNAAMVERLMNGAHKTHADVMTEYVGDNTSAPDDLDDDFAIETLAADGAELPDDEPHALDANQIDFDDVVNG